MEWINQLQLSDLYFGFAFFYPLFMAWLWIAGGIWFYLKHEIKQPIIPEPSKQGCSIIIPCFNEAEQVRDTIRFAMQSQYPNFEVIAVNDGSYQGLGKWIMELATVYIHMTEMMKKNYMPSLVLRGDSNENINQNLSCSMS